MRNLKRKVFLAAVLFMMMCLELYNWMDFEPSPESLMRKGLLEPPSKLAYNLSHPNEDYGGEHGIQPPMTVIRGLLPQLNMTGSDHFFVECGAYDGEMLSSSLYLERQLGWKGLLVEGDPVNYEMLKSKNRKAWLSKTCLSVHPYPHRARFVENNVYGKILKPGEGYANVVEVEIQCLPLFTLLSALNVSTVDYFSLDVEGSEFEVLKTIPFDKIFIKILVVECVHSPDRIQMLDFMKNKDYVEIGKAHFSQKWDNDFLFVHKKVINSEN